MNNLQKYSFKRFRERVLVENTIKEYYNTNLSIAFFNVYKEFYEEYPSQLGRMPDYKIPCFPINKTLIKQLKKENIIIPNRLFGNSFYVYLNKQFNKDISTKEGYLKEVEKFKNSEICHVLSKIELKNC